MTAWRRAIELSIGDADLAALRAIARSRTEPAIRVERARMLLAYRENPSFFAVGQRLGVHHQTVPALRRAGGGLRRAGGPRRPAATGIDDVNKHPVIHAWSYKLAQAA